MTTKRGRVRTETSAKRVRAYLAGRLVLDTTRPLLVWESPHYPTYYVPLADVHAELRPSGDQQRSPSRGVADVYDVVVDGEVADGAALVWVQPEFDAIAGHVRIEWASMTAWFEEDEQVYVHPRDPYTRIDALRSSRHVVVELDGQLLADTHAPVILYETGLVPRHYLPATDVQQQLLVRSDRVTHCPYKGSTVYFHVRVGERVEHDLAWSYPTPLAESAAIAGMICFPADRVELTVDGARHPGG